MAYARPKANKELSQNSRLDFTQLFSLHYDASSVWKFGEEVFRIKGTDVPLTGDPGMWVCLT